MTTSSSSSDNNNAASFRNNYAAALAQALREADAAPRRSSTAEMVDDTYRQLCCDDPLLSSLSVSACHALANALTTTTSSTATQSTTRTVNNNDKKKKNTGIDYALSERLVQGIQDVCHRMVRQNNNQSHNNSQNDNTTNNKDDSDGDQNDSTTQLEPLVTQAEPEKEETLASAFAVLAWICFGRIPLLCCISDALGPARRLLGSLNRTLHDNDMSRQNGDDIQKEQNADAVAEKLQSAIATEPEKELTTTNENNNDDNDSLAEVWAAESDPSDYEFDSGYNPQAQLAELDAWAQDVVENANNPEVLSQASTSTTWLDIRSTVMYLLQELSYSRHLSAMSLSDWRRYHVSDYLSQFTILLLLSSSSTTAGGGGSSSFPLLSVIDTVDSKEQEEEEEKEDLASRNEQQWQQMALQPLHVFRDAVAVHTLEFLPDYLQLIQQLLQVDDQVGNVGKATATTIAPATWIGLSCLSTLCSNVLQSNNSPTRTRIQQQRDHFIILQSLQDFILEQVCDDLASILEKSPQSEAAAAIPWTFLSIFQILTEPTKSAPSPTMNNPQAQTLLNSGLFRQWLVWWSLSSSPDARKSMEQNVLYLCASAPTLLGKYSWRYPGYAAQVTNPIGSDDETKNNGDAESSSPHATLLLWNLLGIHLTKGSAKTPTIKWRNGSKKSDQKSVRPAPSLNECQSQAWSAYAKICKNTASVISDWKTRRACASGDEAESSETWETELASLEEFNSLCKSLSDLSFVLLPIFCFEMMDESVASSLDGDTEKSKMMVRKMVMNSVQQSLTGWVNTTSDPPSSSADKAKVKADDDKAEEDDFSNVESGKDRLRQQRPKLEDEAIARIRKSVKVLQSAIDSCGSGASGNVSSGAGGSMRISSKAD